MLSVPYFVVTFKPSLPEVTDEGKVVCDESAYSNGGS